LVAFRKKLPTDGTISKNKLSAGNFIEKVICYSCIPKIFSEAEPIVQDAQSLQDLND